jgi:FtsZ-binding cell division protein ZapB
VLGDWEKSIHSAADSLLEGLGALVVFGIEALPVLQGGDSWLERFSKLLVPPPLLEANGDLEAWPDLLRRHYIKPSSDNQQDALVLLEQDRERLLEERLQQAINRINTLEAEHDALKTERDGLVTKQQELSTQRDTLSKERDALKTGGTCLRNPFDIAKGTPRYSEADWRDLT